MDIHKEFTVAVVKDEQGIEIAEDKFNNSPEQFTNFLTRFAPEETKIVIESTGVWEYIYDLLEARHYVVKLANPVRTRAIAEARIKTDRVDAATLADLLRADLVAESYIPPKPVRRLREIVRERSVFVKQTTQIKNRIHALLVKRGMNFAQHGFLDGNSHTGDCISPLLLLLSPNFSLDLVHRSRTFSEKHLGGEIQELLSIYCNHNAYISLPQARLPYGVFSFFARRQTEYNALDVHDISTPSLYDFRKE